MTFTSFRHERYLGMWADDLKCGPGMVVTSAGTYCEAIFANGAISVSCIIHESGRRPQGGGGGGGGGGGLWMLLIRNNCAIKFCRLHSVIVRWNL